MAENLGRSESTEKDQIVFHYPSNAAEHWPIHSARSDVSNNKTDDECLRQIGFAQGIINFARDFAVGETVDSVETERRRTVVTELEPGWWILASIDLTQLYNNSSSDSSHKSAPSIEYSTREVSPPALLVQQLLRAHRIYLLHHGPSLADSYLKIGREKFCQLLDTFWTAFARKWYVILHGNPVCDLYAGIKLAAGGELGIGVGEEEWGSGEREVLEGLVHHTDGLIDLCVSRFGNNVEQQSISANNKLTEENASRDHSWIGEDLEPSPADGMIFSGLGNISRASLRQITEWNQWIYKYREHAYGVRENPTRIKRKRKDITVPRRSKITQHGNSRQSEQGDEQEAPNIRETETPDLSRDESRPKIPLPIVSAAETSLKQATSSVDKTQSKIVASSKGGRETTAGTETLVKFLTLGYGSVWGGHTPDVPITASKNDQTLEKKVKDEMKSKKDSKMVERPISQNLEVPPEKASRIQDAAFLIGLLDDIDLNRETPFSTDQDTVENDPNNLWNSRISLRTLYVEVTTQANQKTEKSEASSQKSLQPAEFEEELQTFENAKQATVYLRRLCVVVYVHKPFIFTFLFEPSASSLKLSSFYLELHRNILPLHNQLLSSTSPSNVAARIQAAQVHLTRGDDNLKNPQIYDLVYDPTNLTVRSSIPNISLPGVSVAGGTNKHSDIMTKITRAEAMSLHSQLLVMLKDAWNHSHTVDRSTKTNRGWWLVWMRLSTHKLHNGHKSAAGYRDAIIVRRPDELSNSRAGRYPSDRYNADSQGILNRWVGRNPSGSGNAAGDGQQGALGAGEGIGVNAKKYVESILSLSR